MTTAFRTLQATLAVLLLTAPPAAAQPVPMIDAVPTLAACRNPGAAGNLLPGTDLFRVDVPLAQYPEAVCNDGTPGVFYARKARGRRNRDRWVIFLQGGGACRDGQSCAERWCSIDTNFGAKKMSSRGAPSPGMNGGGIQSRRRPNRFRGWNQVHVYYCSSDSWSGTASNVELQATDGLGNPIDYRVHFHGTQIVDSVIDMLRRGNGPISYTDHRERRRVLPDLDDASRVIFAGTSAGGGGVIQHADRVRELLETHNTRCTPEDCRFDVRAVVDANYGPDHDALGYASSTLCSGAGLCDYEDVFTDRWENVDQDLNGAIQDASCRGLHAPLGDEWMCSDLRHVLENHITTPLFVRHDTQDELIMGNEVDAMFDSGGVLLDFDLWGSLTHAQLEALPLLDTTAEEGSVNGGPGIPTPGVFGAQCGHHGSLTNDSRFLRVRAPTPGGQLQTTNKTLANWVRGRPRSIAIEPFAGAGVLASCP